jgi:hypothetical protein
MITSNSTFTLFNIFKPYGDTQLIDIFYSPEKEKYIGCTEDTINIITDDFEYITGYEMDPDIANVAGTLLGEKYIVFGDRLGIIDVPLALFDTSENLHFQLKSEYHLIESPTEEVPVDPLFPDGPKKKVRLKSHKKFPSREYQIQIASDAMIGLDIIVVNTNVPRTVILAKGKPHGIYKIPNFKGDPSRGFVVYLDGKLITMDDRPYTITYPDKYGGDVEIDFSAIPGTDEIIIDYMPYAETSGYPERAAFDQPSLFSIMWVWGGTENPDQELDVSHKYAKMYIDGLRIPDYEIKLMGDLSRLWLVTGREIDSCSMFYPVIDIPPYGNRTESLNEKYFMNDMNGDMSYMNYLVNKYK